MIGVTDGNGAVAAAVHEQMHLAIAVAVDDDRLQAVGLYGCTGGSNQAWSVAANSSAASAIASAASGLGC